MRHSLAAPGALLLASVCAGLSVHSAYLFMAVRGAPASSLIWPFTALGILAAASGTWMGIVGWAKRPAPLKWRKLAPRSLVCTMILSGATVPWFFVLTGISVEPEDVWAAVTAALGYWLALSAVTPYVTNSILQLDDQRAA